MKNYIFTKQMKDGSEHLIHKHCENEQEAKHFAGLFNLTISCVEENANLDSNGDPIWNIPSWPIQ